MINTIAKSPGEILPALGVPAVHGGGGNLLDTREAKDGLAMLRFLADPRDDVALAAGAHKLEIRLPRVKDPKGGFERVLYASDALCLYRGQFHPNSKFKPGEDYHSAEDGQAAAQAGRSSDRRLMVVLAMPGAAVAGFALCLNRVFAAAVGLMLGRADLGIQTAAREQRHGKFQHDQGIPSAQTLGGR